MAEVIYAKAALADLERLEAAAPGARTLIKSAVMVLARHPLIGRGVESGFRELVISRGKTGYVALYDFDEADAGEELVVVHGLRHQREVEGD